jgi:hypothetical protein
MKPFRVILLMTLLLAGATTRTPQSSTEAKTATQVAEPECYFINGVWYCP